MLSCPLRSITGNVPAPQAPPRASASSPHPDTPHPTPPTPPPPRASLLSPVDRSYLRLTATSCGTHFLFVPSEGSTGLPGPGRDQDQDGTRTGPGRDQDGIRNMSRAEERADADCVCSVGMKFTWDINDPKLPQVPPITNRSTVTMS